MLHIALVESSNGHTVRNISEEKLYSINTNKNKISSSQRWIQQSCHIFIRQQLGLLIIFTKSSTLDVWQDFCLSYCPKFTLRFYEKISSSFAFLLLMKTCICFNIQCQEHFHFSKNWYFKFTFLTSQKLNLASI